MSEIAITCPGCRQQSSVDRVALGSQVQCPSCGRYFVAVAEGQAPRAAISGAMQVALANQAMKRNAFLVFLSSKMGLMILLILLFGGMFYYVKRESTRSSSRDQEERQRLMYSGDWGGRDGRVIGKVTSLEEREGIDIPPQALPSVGEKAGDRLVISLGGGVTMAFRWCPRGVFLMGGRYSDERPRRAVAHTRGYWLAETELTQVQWLAIMGTDLDEQRRLKLSYPPYRTLNSQNWRYHRAFNTIPVRGDDCPMFFISWEDCEALTKRLNQHFRIGDPVRLPTEAEWEYACRANTQTKFHFGDSASERSLAQFGNNWYKTPPAKVGSYPSNAWGLCDMHGNLWEWCSDWYSKRSYQMTKVITGNPEGVAEGESSPVAAKNPPDDPWSRAVAARDAYAAASSSFKLSDSLAALIESDRGEGFSDRSTKVLRGGSFMWRDCRSANRHAEIPEHRSISVGVRLVLDLDSTEAPDHGEVTQRTAGEDLSIELPGDVPIVFRWIPAGTFSMGTQVPKHQAFDDKPHQVTLTKGFWMGETEVTQGQWDALLGLRDPVLNRAGSLERIGARGDSYPICFVSIQHCERYMKYLEPWLPQGLTARLPTEAQWEYSCRAGTTTPWNTGEEINRDLANISASTAKKPNRTKSLTRAGTFPANAWGLHDMHGNLWEWCADLYDEEFYGNPNAAKDPLCLTGDHQVMRGGSWNFEAWGARSGFRNWGSRRSGYNRVGLRIVLEQKEN